MEVIPAADLVNFKNQILDFFHQLHLIVKYPNNNLDLDLFELEIRAFLDDIGDYPLNNFDLYERNIIDCLKVLTYEGEFKKNIKKKIFERKLLKIYPNHQG